MVKNIYMRSQFLGTTFWRKYFIVWFSSTVSTFQLSRDFPFHLEHALHVTRITKFLFICIFNFSRICVYEILLELPGFMLFSASEGNLRTKIKSKQPIWLFLVFHARTARTKVHQGQKVTGSAIWLGNMWVVLSVTQKFPFVVFLFAFLFFTFVLPSWLSVERCYI